MTRAKPPTSRRRVAGEDPKKRAQILAGARTVFIAKGFDAAGTNDIAQAAGVSKSTLYVYFANKEQLFVALLASESAAQRAEIYAALEGSGKGDLGSMLGEFARRVLILLTRPEVLRAQRVVLGATERVPNIGRQFFENGPGQSAARLARVLAERGPEAGLAIADPQRAAAQFISLLQAQMLTPRLYGAVTTPPSDDEIAATVQSAVRLFMRGYAAD